jgi:hypothetical protein
VLGVTIVAVCPQSAASSALTGRLHHSCGRTGPSPVARGGPIVGTRIAASNGMNNLIRGVAAGGGAWLLGGGVISTLVIFAVIWWFLGH